MRIGILLPTNVYFSPYARTYTDIFDETGIDYDILYFDKRNLNEPAAYRFAADGSVAKYKLIDKGINIIMTPLRRQAPGVYTLITGQRKGCVTEINIGK